MKQLLCKLFRRNLPAVENILQNFKMDILSIKHILFHQVAAGPFGSEVDELGSSQLWKGSWWIECRESVNIFDRILEPDQLCNHKQVLHNSTILIIFVDYDIVSFLVLERHIDQCLILQSEKLLLSLLNILCEFHSVLTAYENLLVEALQWFHLRQENSLYDWNRLWSQAGVVVVR